MNFYVSIFKNSKVLGVTPGPNGIASSVNFELEGQEFIGLNAGPQFKFNESVSFMVDCEDQAAGDLVKRLSVYRLRRPIRMERVEDVSVHWSRNGDEGVPDPRLPELGRRWLGPPTEPASGWLVHRLRLGVCEGRAELGDLLWLECNAAELNGVSFSKGCFVGQENTARMNWRQKINRRLVVVKGDGGERVRIAYPDLGLAVVHVRADAMPDAAIIPDWLASAISNSTKSG